MVFEADCRNCPHTITKSLEATEELVESKYDVRVRCKECRKINTVEQTGVA